MRRVFGLAILTAGLSFAATQHSFRVSQTAEIVVDLEMSAAGFDWSIEGMEAPMAAITVDGRSAQHVMLYAGAAKFHYKLFLGALAPGAHELAIAGSGFETHSAAFREVAASDPLHAVLANAPIVFARKNTIGKFTDIPLVLYAERLSSSSRSASATTVSGSASRSSVASRPPASASSGPTGTTPMRTC